MIHLIGPEELKSGDVVTDGAHSFEVYSVEQHQGYFQVADTTGATHTYPRGAVLEVR